MGLPFQRLRVPVVCAVAQFIKAYLQGRVPDKVLSIRVGSPFLSRLLEQALLFLLHGIALEKFGHGGHWGRLQILLSVENSESPRGNERGIAPKSVGKVGASEKLGLELIWSLLCLH